MSLTLASSTSTTALPERWVERLFERMLLDYGKKFSDQWGGADTDALIAHWSRELAGYSGTELKRGLEALATKEWPPTLPEFKKLCRRPLDATAAYYEAVAGTHSRAGGKYGKWSHPAIYWAAMPLSFELREQTYAQMKGRWEAAFQEQMDKGEWEEIPQAMVALPAPGKAKTSREEASQRLKELGAGGIVKDHRGGAMRAWVGRVLEREAAGDTTLPMISAKFAHEVLDARPE
jgi:hypothetical protein